MSIIFKGRLALHNEICHGHILFVSEVALTACCRSAAPLVFLCGQYALLRKPDASFLIAAQAVCSLYPPSGVVLHSID